jgi:hypothetical protein
MCSFSFGGSSAIPPPPDPPHPFQFRAYISCCSVPPPPPPCDFSLSAALSESVFLLVVWLLLSIHTEDSLADVVMNIS